MEKGGEGGFEHRTDTKIPLNPPFTKGGELARAHVEFSNGLSGLNCSVLVDLISSDVHNGVHTCTGGFMREATFTELRTHAKDYFDAVEGGETVRVFRNGKPIAEIVPIRSGVPSWKRQSTPLTVKGLSLSREILSDREDSA